MTQPLNFDSIDLDALLTGWTGTLGAQGVDAVVVLGPCLLSARERRVVLAVHPPRLLPAAQALAESDDFGSRWHDSDAPLAAWQTLTPPSAPSGWRSLWLAHGQRALLRVAFALPAGRAFECFLFSPHTGANPQQMAALAWSVFNVWPRLRRALTSKRLNLSPREQESLRLAFEGLTARETAQRMACSERTVNFHLTNAMAKLQADNKLAAVQRACWLGVV